MKYFRADWLRPLIILKRRDEGMAIPPAFLVVGRKPYLMQEKMESHGEGETTSVSYRVVPLNHRYLVRLNLFLVVFETAFVWPKINT